MSFLHSFYFSFFVGGSDILDEIAKGELTLPEVVYSMHTEYGPVIILFFFHFHIVSIVDPKAAKELLMDNDFVKPFISYRGFQKVFGQRFMGYGLLSELDNAIWERHRKIFNPAFHRKYLMELMHVFNDSSDRLIQYLSLKADGKSEVNLMNAFGRLTLDVIAKCYISLVTALCEKPQMFSMVAEYLNFFFCLQAGFAMEDDMVLNDTPFTDALEMAFEAMSKQAQDIFLSMNPRYSAFKYRSKARKAIQLLRKTGGDIIRQRIEDQKQGKDLPKDILSFIIKEAIVEENFSIEEMVDEFVTFFGAGQETTANLLSFTLLCLGRYPEVLKKLLQEVDTIVGQKDTIEYDDIGKMEYLMLVLKESLRLYPPVFGTGRYIHRKIRIAGYDMPVGANVFFCNYAMNRSEDYFKNPLTFDPERFRREEDKPLYVYMPFSMGPRSCIGQQFALIEARVVIAKLLQKLSFSLVPGQKLGVKERLTLKPAGDCLNYVTHRLV
ncbi:putative cholesterol 24-hydroxylase [Apostichopus japonicus]|uniref:Putative cholesterol 24-hydroxylase n=1 Tax=Stichopus japonicus TaxID=307972 RepID=A0A2G8JY28_STIJA|nr:putative cholesterol 24-hydroxylase [Apostichopus japonicus]